MKMHRYSQPCGDRFCESDFTVFTFDIFYRSGGSILLCGLRLELIDRQNHLTFNRREIVRQTDCPG
jgi:hypothetical protein